MKLSARNQLKGKVVDIKEGAVNGIVSLETKGGEIITSTISMGSIKELGLKIGSEAYAVIKATSVMMMVDQFCKKGLEKLFSRPFCFIKKSINCIIY